MNMWQGTLFSMVLFCKSHTTGKNCKGHNYSQPALSCILKAESQELNDTAVA